MRSKWLKKSRKQKTIENKRNSQNEREKKNKTQLMITRLDRNSNFDKIFQD